ncbi:MAG: YceI family protein [Roseovarius sp.]|nr:YceI family protein [Roseovarius sp.]MCY4207561.1 YceI family protein [Roseovarius sp.]MCY4290663.1 YceI family protein [Roseovarius sp.]MCY4317151.1 YceI family protein [Roseovarius sp.]
MKHCFLALAMAVLGAAALAESERYELDASHSQIVFSYRHLGYSTTYGMFSGFEGEIMFDKENPANSSVNVSIPVTSMLTGWEARFRHFMSEDFFFASEDDMITFTSTGIEIAGEDTGQIFGDLSMNGITKTVVLDAKLNRAEPHPMLDGRPWVGFDATATLLRSDFDLGKFAPFVSDEVEVAISVEAGRAE